MDPALQVLLGLILANVMGVATVFLLARLYRLLDKLEVKLNGKKD